MVSKKTLVKLGQIAEKTRMETKLSFADACIVSDLSPSTLYGYINIIKAFFIDIEYNKGYFKVK